MLLVSSAAFAQSIRIVAIGDSNTAGFGVAREEAFPARLEALLRAAGHDAQVWNAGITGDTFYGILARLDRYVPEGIQIAIVQAGFNDMLRRTEPTLVVGHIEAILARLQARRVNTVLCGFFYPDWDAVGQALARQHGAVFVDGGSCYDGRYRIDGLHMSPAGHQMVAARLLPVIEGLVAQARNSARIGQPHRLEAHAARPSRAKPQPARASAGAQVTNAASRAGGKGDRNGRAE
ncbi:MAG TPA: GDSL-type esterase/lipase family protein [Beijerinckiaceae bacterium]|nr:GDSL-type esterase/lipase family protein [Beijerinckiaceae bacterium]